MLDGGIVDSIPVERAQALGYEHNVVVLTRNRDYRKGPNGMMPLIRAWYFRYPQLVRQVARRHETYNRTLEEVARTEEAGETFVLCPKKPVEVGRIEKDRGKVRRSRDGIEDLLSLQPPQHLLPRHRAG